MVYKWRLMCRWKSLVTALNGLFYSCPDIRNQKGSRDKNELCRSGIYQYV